MKRPTWMLAWTDEMSVGVPEIDEAHQHFIRLINDLNRSITEGKARSEIRDCLQLVLDDAQQHFSEEEQLLRELRYPGIDYHAQMHARIMGSLQLLKEKFVPYGADSGWVDAGLMIKNILLEHILHEDAKHADFYRNARQKG